MGGVHFCHQTEAFALVVADCCNSHRTGHVPIEQGNGGMNEQKDEAIEESPGFR